MPPRTSFFAFCSNAWDGELKREKRSSQGLNRIYEIVVLQVDGGIWNGNICSPKDKGPWWSRGRQIDKSWSTKTKHHFSMISYTINRRVSVSLLWHFHSPKLSLFDEQCWTSRNIFFFCLLQVAITFWRATNHTESWQKIIKRAVNSSKWDNRLKAINRTLLCICYR